MAADFELKPLSSGIGLGTVKASKPRKSEPTLRSAVPMPIEREAVKPEPPAKPVDSRPKLQNPLEINPSLEPREAQLPRIPTEALQQATARAAYAPHSRATEIRAKPAARFFVWAIRSIFGWGLDVFVVCVSSILCAILATLAWRMGQGVADGSDPYAAIAELINRGINAGPLGVLFFFVGSFLVYFAAMKFVAGSTIGGSFRREMRS